MTKTTATKPAAITTPDAAMLRHLDRVMSRVNADIAAYRVAEAEGWVVPSLAEQARDRLYARGLARATRARFYARMYGC